MPESPDTGSTHGRSRLPAALYILRGAGVLRRNRSLWKYAAAPLIISFGLVIAGYFLIYQLFTAFVPDFGISAWYWQILYYLLVAAVTVASFVATFFLFVIIGTTIGAPFNDLLSEKVEQLEMGVSIEQRFSVIQLIKDIGRGLGHTFKILGVYVAGQLIGLIFLFTIPILGQFIYTVLTLGVASFILSMEFMSYSMDRRRMTFTEKKRFFSSHPRSCLGFGLGASLIASMPLVNLFVIPAAVAGGTILFLELSPEHEMGSGGAV
jgi:CysZ protein